MCKQPPFLKSADTIAIVAPARKVTKKELQPALDFIASKGYKVWLGPHLFETHHQYAGTDEQRLNDIQQALDNPNVKAILCARGGYGTSRIIDQINFDQFLNSPKWVAGFSDNTTLHCHLNGLGVQSIHATVPLLMGKKETTAADNALMQILSGSLPNFLAKTNPLNQMGVVETTIVGGNLTLISNMLGTSSELNVKDKILFIEDVDEHLYHFDRMLVQLRRANVLNSITGLIVGHFSKIKDSKNYFGKSIEEIIIEHVSHRKIPVSFDFPAGHEHHNMPLIFGRKVKFEVTDSNSLLTYS